MITVNGDLIVML